MEQPVIAVYDANILYSAPVRDLFIRIAQAGLVLARWTETIHDEWIRNVLNNNTNLSKTAQELLATLESQGLTQSVARLRKFINLL